MIGLGEEQRDDGLGLAADDGNTVVKTSERSFNPNGLHVENPQNLFRSRYYFERCRWVIV